MNQFLIKNRLHQKKYKILWNQAGIRDMDKDEMELDLTKVRDLELNMIFEYLNDLADKPSDLQLCIKLVP